MRIPPPRPLTVALLSLAVLALAACKETSAPPAPARAQEAARRGRELYLRGVPVDGKELSVEMAGGSVVVPMATLPCVNCHGEDGRGLPEGGVVPSNIRWEALTRPYVVAEGSGRKRPPYNERLLVRAVTMGLDSAGQRLGDVMPRYRLPREEMEDLLAYLQVLGKEGAPGVTEDEIRIGAILPAAGPLAESGRAARAAVAAYFEELNHRGGIYGRKLVLRSLEVSASPEAQVSAARDFLAGERPLAITGLLLGAEETGIAALVEEQRVPRVGAIARFPPAPSSAARYSFYLYPGVAEQGQVLAAAAARELSGKAAVVYPEEPAAREAAQRIAAYWRTQGVAEVAEVALAPGTGERVAAGLSRDGIRAVVLLGLSGEESGFWKVAARSGWRPLILVPGAPAEAGLFAAPPVLSGRLLASFPVVPSARAPEALAEYRALAAAHSLPAEHAAAQWSALAGAKLLVEGLVRSGRQVDREALVRALEGIRGLHTGLVPPLTYGRERRIGALGAYVVGVDLQGQRFVPRGEWNELR